MLFNSVFASIVEKGDQSGKRYKEDDLKKSTLLYFIVECKIVDLYIFKIGKKAWGHFNDFSPFIDRRLRNFRCLPFCMYSVTEISILLAATPEVSVLNCKRVNLRIVFFMIHIFAQISISI